MKRRLVAGCLAAVTVISLCGAYAAESDGGAEEGAALSSQSARAAQEITLRKSDTGNPMLGFDGDGGTLYGGDPSILVDGDTVYAYVGHDTSPGEWYQMPDWRCYSSQDMINWTYEGAYMNEDSIPWGKHDDSAWAGQVMRHGDRYYFYYCSESQKDGKCVGVAVSDSPTGPFIPEEEPIVWNTADTPNSVHGWEDIDPTAWVETDEQGVERRYLCWGNTRLFICELNEDMVSIQDRDGVEGISCGGPGSGSDIIVCQIEGMEGHTFTEAPWLYRQSDGKGGYEGPYYMFFAADWREQMAYATTDDLMSGVFQFGRVIQEPSATGNTNHMAVFDFKGQSCFVYHDGSLPHGSGFRRVACVEPLSINPDGTIDPIKKTAVGLTGTVSQITDFNGGYVAHAPFENPLDDSFYPIKDKALACKADQAAAAESEWEILPGKADQAADSYVSIESNNKPGLYLTAGTRTGSTVAAVLSQDAMGTDDEAASQTFRTLKGLAGSGVTFESVKYPGCYLTSRDGALSFTEHTEDKEAVTFFVSTEAGGAGSVQKTRRLYYTGDTLNVDDIRVRVYQERGGDGKMTDVTDFTTNASELDMSTPGSRLLKVTYQLYGRSFTESVIITVTERGT